ncbi:hypothetical protein [Hyalangium rubrum]|uniref:PEGA domain-containing protein n=1 Tax=Hyalangium rubrum TaxID=3103134 RepID=A0ABU5GYN7_9BACT|nr:hypothetical protein [Hyalangium sp. s54d21]MDY7226156.1 hypothetical protein [Hyalangium sp. s54d21]
MKLPLLLLLLALPATAAERLSVRILDGGSLGASEAERALGAATELARELTSLTVNPVSGLSRRCADDACLRERLTEAQAEQGLFLLVTPARRGSVEVELAWVEGVQANPVRRKVSGVALAGLKEALRPALAALVPAFARKGWGGLVLEAESARVRVDGRVLVLSGEVTPLPAGPHEVDLLLPSGEASLSRELVPEGARLRLTAPTEASSPLAPGAAPRGKGLRATSYVTFSLGALAVAGSLVAGGLSRGARADVRPCLDSERVCTRYPEAREAYEKSDRYARAGNVLLGVGGALSAAGVGLFVFDLASAGE